MFFYTFRLASFSAYALGAQQVPLSDPTSSPFTASFDKLVSQNLDQWHTPGLAIAVINGDDTFSKGYGIATFPDKPITPETLFYTASTTKSFTAAAVSLLIDDSVNINETISWQVPLAKVIREDFVLADEYATVHVTIEDALSHRTGMPRHDLSYGRPKMTVREVVENLRHLPMTAELRTRFQYCNMMYIVISHFIETWTGMWLGDFLRTRIYEPLSMYSTFFSLSDAQKAAASGGPSLSTPYFWTNKTKTYHSLPWLDAPQESGCGATISNVLDYAKWLRCMMTMSAPLSAAGHHAIRSPRIITGPVTEEPTGFRGSEAYALGWSVSNYRGEVLMWHTGGLPGFNSVMMYFPRLQWGITMMANGGQGAAIQVLLFKLIDDMLGIPEQERFDWAPLMELNEILELETLKNAKNLLFPSVPKRKDSIPLSLPLESYAGTYQHEGYPPITLTINSSTHSHTASQPQATLHCLTQYEQYPFTLSFQHISGENFMIYIRFFTAEAREAPDDYEITTDGLSKAEFRLGENGQVKELGVLLEPEMGEAKIWFKKAGAENGGGYEKCFTAGSSAVMAESNQGASSAGGQRKLFSRFGRSLAPLFAAGDVDQWTQNYLQATYPSLESAHEKTIGNASAASWTSTEGGNTPIMAGGEWLTKPYTSTFVDTMLDNFDKIVTYKMINYIWNASDTFVVYVPYGPVMLNSDQMGTVSASDCNRWKGSDPFLICDAPGPGIARVFNPNNDKILGTANPMGTTSGFKVSIATPVAIDIYLITAGTVNSWLAGNYNYDISDAYPDVTKSKLTAADATSLAKLSVTQDRAGFFNLPVCKVLDLRSFPNAAAGTGYANTLCGCASKSAVGGASNGGDIKFYDSVSSKIQQYVLPEW